MATLSVSWRTTCPPWAPSTLCQGMHTPWSHPFSQMEQREVSHPSMIPTACWTCVRGNGRCLHPGLMHLNETSHGIPAYMCSKHDLETMSTHTFAAVGEQVTVQRTQMALCMWWLWILAHGPQMEVAWPPAESWSWITCSMSVGQCCLRSAMTSSRYTSWSGCWVRV